MLDPTRAYYQRQISQATGLALRAIQRELERLSEVGLVLRWEQGNRAYYQVDRECALYPELRALVLKAAGPADQLRGWLALDPQVLLLFLDGTGDRALAVTHEGRRPRLSGPSPIQIDVMAHEAFIQRLQAAPRDLAPFLEQGVDLLGRRELVVWRRIEAAGYDVPKGKGVP